MASCEEEAALLQGFLLPHLPCSCLPQSGLPAIRAACSQGCPDPEPCMLQVLCMYKTKDPAAVPGLGKQLVYAPIDSLQHSWPP